jgi:hypothetical protein
MDCFFIGRLSGSKGSVWQYTAIDVASGFTWAELHSSTQSALAPLPVAAAPLAARARARRVDRMALDQRLDCVLHSGRSSDPCSWKEPAVRYGRSRHRTPG